jgi:hypothetical protein
MKEGRKGGGIERKIQGKIEVRIRGKMEGRKQGWKKRWKTIRWKEGRKETSKSNPKPKGGGVLTRDTV